MAVATAPITSKFTDVILSFGTERTSASTRKKPSRNSSVSLCACTSVVALGAPLGSFGDEVFKWMDEVTSDM